MEKSKRLMTPFQWFECLAITAFTVYFALTNGTDPWWYIVIDAVAAICGVFCVVLCAGGQKSQYYWGFPNVIAYIVIAFINKYYGEVMLNALYYLPTQFIGLRMWNRHMNQKDGRVEGLRMNAGCAAVWALCSAAGIFIYKLILDALGGNGTLLDSASTVLSLAANALMVLRYREQWVLWIVVDAITVLMWLLAGDVLMTAMWSIYLINAVYGFVMWSKMSAQDKNKEAQNEHI